MEQSEEYYLMESGVEVIEIPRYKNEGQEIISASLPRKYVNAKQYDKLGDYLTESTIAYLKTIF